MALIEIRNPVLRVVSAATVGVVTMIVVDLLISDDGLLAATVQSVLTTVIALGILYVVFIRRRDESED